MSEVCLSLLWVSNVERSLFPFASRGYVQEGPHGIRHATTLANHPTHVFFRYLQPEHGGWATASLSDVHLSGIVNQGTSDELD